VADIVRTPAFDRDILEVYRYLLGVAPSVAGRLEAEIRPRLERLAAHPLSGVPRDEVAPGLRVVLASPYLIFHRYDASRDRVTLIAFLHERRDLPRLVRRR
jgi:toxin ParE1/3/4